MFRDLIQLVQVLPGRKAASFRLKCANFLCRLLTGDRTLIPQIINASENISQEAANVMMQDVPVARVEISSVEKRCRDGHMLLDLEERKIKIEEQNFDFQVKRFKAIKDEFGMDDRDKLYYKDLFKKSSDPGYAAIQNTEDVRGREISIALVCQEIGINPQGKNPQIGRVMAKKWRERFPDNEIPKRDTIFLGRPYKENAYYQCDYDLMEQSIRDVCC